jgi:hypothetical protein
LSGGVMGKFQYGVQTGPWSRLSSICWTTTIPDG